MTKRGVNLKEFCETFRIDSEMGYYRIGEYNDRVYWDLEQIVEMYMEMLRKVEDKGSCSIYMDELGERFWIRNCNNEIEAVILYLKCMKEISQNFDETLLASGFDIFCLKNCKVVEQGAGMCIFKKGKGDETVYYLVKKKDESDD